MFVEVVVDCCYVYFIKSCESKFDLELMMLAVRRRRTRTLALTYFVSAAAPPVALFATSREGSEEPVNMMNKRGFTTNNKVTH